METGRQLLHYRLIEKIGEGGMGVVWKAVDTSLDREVAIKVLPETLAADAERLARFEREAKVLASLSHTNIASIFGLHSADGLRFLAMELVAGEDLAQRLKRGALPVDEALDIARQVAEGLEAAHKNGIVHRDLKPGNVMLTPEGQVKVLDFGLARALATDPVSGSTDPSLSPTLTSAGTMAGTILGTAGYMSPEQARGRPVDRRADVWSLGVILFEMLCGRQMFEGETISDSLASVLKTEPEWSALPGGVPASIRRLLRRCLAKNPHDRVHDAADARIVLVEALSGDVDEPLAHEAAPARRSGGPLTIAAVVVAALALVYAFFLAPRSSSPTLSGARFEVAAETLDFSTGALPFALSPDGQVLVYVDYDGPATRLFVRRMDSFDVQSLPGTEGAGAPFFSPDGEWIGFYAYGKLKKIALAGGQPIELCPTPHAAGGAAWLEDGTIVYSMAFTPTGLYRVSDDGGEPEVLTVPDTGAGEFNHGDPQVLPGGERVVFSVSSTAGKQGAVMSLDGGERTLLDDVQGRVRFVESGHLLYGVDGTVLAVPFDAERGEATGPPVAVLEDVGVFMGGASFAVSRSGTLAYLPPIRMDYVWVDREGKITPLGVDDNTGSRPILSHDGRRLAIAGGTSARGQHIHIYDLERGGRVRLPGFAHMMWSTDDSEVFTLLRVVAGSDLFRLRADGSGEPELLFESENNSVVTSVSQDMKWMLFYEQDPVTSRDIWALPLDGSGDAVPVVKTPASERAATFSPDGRWFAYASNRSGRDEVYVRRFDPTGENTADHLVSTNGGREPQWSRDGKELFYRVGRALMAVRVDLGDGLTAGEPEELFEGSWSVEAGGMNQMYDVTPDAQRFVMVRTAEESNAIRVGLGWLDELDLRPAGP